MLMPIIAIDRNGEMNLFRSLEEAESSIEPEDAKAGEYRAFDASGRVLHPQVQKGGFLSPARVKIIATEEMSGDALQYLLREFLSRAAGQEISPDTSLAMLVEKSERFLRRE